MNNKQCFKCQITYPLNHFAFRNKKKGTKHGRCRLCRAEYYKSYYEADKSRHKTRSKKWAKKAIIKNQQYVKDYLITRHCIDCETTDIRVLEFDHIDPPQKKDNIAHMIFNYSLESVKKEIDKCEVRCANCHRIKTLEDAGTSWRLT